MSKKIQTPAHTKGHWRFYVDPQPNGCPIVGSDGVMIAMLAHSVNEPSQKEEALANARLIASAPELLEVLSAIINDGIHSDVVPHLHEKARAAIARVEASKP